MKTFYNLKNMYNLKCYKVFDIFTAQVPKTLYIYKVH